MLVTVSSLEYTAAVQTGKYRIQRRDGERESAFESLGAMHKRSCREWGDGAALAQARAYEELSALTETLVELTGTRQEQLAATTSTR
jgi:hypothetical protein